jgi:iron complex transport system substrate-binding protein
LVQAQSSNVLIWRLVFRGEKTVMAKASLAHECCRSDGNGKMGDFIELPGVLGLVNLEKVIAAQPDVYLVSGARTPKAGDPLPAG